MLAESAFFLAYFVFSAPTSKLIETIGYKRTMVVSLFIQVVGCLLFVPAAKLVSFPFVRARFLWWEPRYGFTDRGEPVCFHSGARRQRFDPPEPGTGLQFHRRDDCADYRRRLTSLPIWAHRPPRRALRTRFVDLIRIAGGLLILGIAVALAHLPPIIETQAFRPGKEGDPVLSRSIWSYRHTVLGALGIFLYVGVEVGLASLP